MKTNLLRASLLALCSCAAATAAPAAPTSARCTSGGDVLFQIQTKLEQPTYHVPTSRTSLLASGLWTRVELDANGEQTRTTSGCLGEDQLAEVRSLLEHATWTVKQADAACAAISSTYTEYSAHGKVLWDQHMCQLTYLDTDSQQALDAITKLLGPA